MKISRYYKACVEEVLLNWERQRCGSGEIFSQQDLTDLVNRITKQTQDEDKRRGWLQAETWRRASRLNGGKDWV